MKKVLALIMAVLLMVALCGCSKAEYGDLRIMEGVQLSELEGYGIAFRKGSDVVERVEKAIDELYEAWNNYSYSSGDYKKYPTLAELLMISSNMTK